MEKYTLEIGTWIKKKVKEDKLGHQVKLILENGNLTNLMDKEN